jgi:Mg-chelatase subunit ChlD
VDRVLGLRGHGVTGLAGALRFGAEALADARAARRVVVLLSDCRATDGEDPVASAASIPDLIVVAPRDDGAEAAALAAAAGAKCATLDSLDGAVALLNELLA